MNDFVDYKPYFGNAKLISAGWNGELFRAYQEFIRQWERDFCNDILFGTTRRKKVQQVNISGRYYTLEAAKKSLKEAERQVAVYKSAVESLLHQRIHPSALPCAEWDPHYTASAVDGDEKRTAIQVNGRWHTTEQARKLAAAIIDVADALEAK